VENEVMLARLHKDLKPLRHSTTIEYGLIAANFGMIFLLAGIALGG